jgi:hypothetical protein
MSSCAAAGAGTDIQPTPPSTPATHLSAAQSLYLERCGGCHGIQGSSAPAVVPSLKSQVGYFLCIPAGRSYLIQLPSVALAPVSDQALADLMNFVVFDMGGGQAQVPATRPFTAAEVNMLRRHPLRDVSLLGYRAQLVEDVIQRCGAPVRLRAYGNPRQAPDQ